MAPHRPFVLIPAHADQRFHFMPITHSGECRSPSDVLFQLAKAPEDEGDEVVTTKVVLGRIGELLRLDYDEDCFNVAVRRHEPCLHPHAGFARDHRPMNTRSTVSRSSMQPSMWSRSVRYRSSLSCFRY